MNQLNSRTNKLKELGANQKSLFYWEIYENDEMTMKPKLVYIQLKAKWYQIASSISPVSTLPVSSVASNSDHLKPDSLCATISDILCASSTMQNIP
jgi:hypothetical protein